MSAHNTPKEKPTGDGNPTVGGTHGAIVPRLWHSFKVLAIAMAAVIGGMA